MWCNNLEEGDLGFGDELLATSLGRIRKQGVTVGRHRLCRFEFGFDVPDKTRRPKLGFSAYLGKSVIDTYLSECVHYPTVLLCYCVFFLFVLVSPIKSTT